LALAASRRFQVRKRCADFAPLLARNCDGWEIDDLATLACLRQNEQPRRLSDQPAQGVVRSSQRSARGGVDLSDIKLGKLRLYDGRTVPAMDQSRAVEHVPAATRHG
jgi:hypothetical protein